MEMDVSQKTEWKMSEKTNVFPQLSPNTTRLVTNDFFLVCLFEAIVLIFNCFKF